ncbi:Homeobox-leucine zipper protein TF1 [Dichanthelium oligosanthes]|uniref:Homeobox-leucine zipper protein TF1 n=1 Tax=Dichanthelium oligosanthes TaxID=888268 RepID=A0A1E5VMX0_9POAL|nr:Homeobox-leucine zipper protein TF1 [Dichanthelium oligosanthes]
MGPASGIGNPSLMGSSGGTSDPSLMGSTDGICDPSLMGSTGGIGDGGLSPNMNATYEMNSSNPFEELQAANGLGQSPGGGASRINEVDSSILVSNNNGREESPGDGQEGSQRKKRCLHRLTSRQSEILEGFFSVCAHPDENQRRQLAATTGLGLHQVKFWFQNKRTHVKHLSGKEENYRLRVENEMLREENSRFRQAQSNGFCPGCSNDPAQLLIFKELERLKLHNQLLQQELQNRMNNETPMPMSSPPARLFRLESSSENFFAIQDDVQALTEVAKSAAQEVFILCDANGPLWLAVPGGSYEVLNKIAYAQAFPEQISVGAIGLKTEATRASAVVMLDAKSIVEYLMDAGSNGTFFPGLMTTATTTKVYNWPANPEAGYDGAMQLMTVELVYPSPQVPARKCTFLRYCERLEQGVVAVVDVSLDDGANTCRKMPSGVLIQPIRHNSCKVTAIEHVRVDDSDTHAMFQPCLNGLLFGARRWVTSMARQCARIRDVFHVTNCTLIVTSKGRKTIMKLADNLLANYTSSIAGIPVDAWSVQCGDGTEQDVRIVYRKSDDTTNTAVVCASATFLLPLPMRIVFDMLKNNLLRVKWDVLVNGGCVKDEVRVANGVGSEDAVSILHVKHGSGANKETTMVLQNSCYDASGAFMVYASLDKHVMDMITSPDGEQALSNIFLFPAGFFLVPLPDPVKGGAAIGEAGGTVMTAGFQILMKLARGTGLCPKSVSSAIKIMTENIATIKDTLMNSHPVFYNRNQSTN